MIRRGIRGRIRPAVDLPGGDGFRRVFSFRRVWIAIGILAVFDIVFIIPAIGVLGNAAETWGSYDDLFDLVAALFLSAWLLGWSLGPLIMTTVLALMLFGREVVRVRNDSVRIFIGLPLIGLAADYKVSHMRNLRLEAAEKASGKSWRGSHLAFDYGANTVAFGSDAETADVAVLGNSIEMESGMGMRRGEATAEELEERWDPVTEVPLPRRSEIDAAPEPVTWSSPSTLMLIIANLVPVAGTVYLGWQLSDVMVLYWAESAIIGFYNVCKLAVISRWMALFSGTFFIAHFGAFMAVHFLFIWGIFVKGFDDSTGGDLGEVGQLFIELWPALLALFVSHGISFFTNFIGRREYLYRTANDQMGEPYTRIILMHVVLIVGGGLALVLGSSTPVLLVVIAGKIGFDLRAHIRERAKAS